MKLNVATELKLPGREGHAVLCERIEDIEYPGRWIRFADDVTVEINYVFDGSGFETSGSVKTALKGECARCAKELMVPFAHEFEERFEKNAPEDGDAYPFSGEELDLSDLVRDTILLNMENYVLCKDDCRGIQYSVPVSRKRRMIIRSLSSRRCLTRIRRCDKWRSPREKHPRRGVIHAGAATGSFPSPASWLARSAMSPSWPTGFARIAAITTASRSSRLKKPNNLFDLKVNRGCVSRILFLRYSEICDRIAYIFNTEGYLHLYDTHSVRRYGRG